MIPPALRDVRFQRRADGKYDVVMSSDAGERELRALPTALRRTFGEVRPFRIDSQMTCPRCDGPGPFDRGKNTSSGRAIYEYYCPACRWMLAVDSGPSMATIYATVAEESARAQDLSKPGSGRAARHRASRHGPERFVGSGTLSR